MAIVSDLTGLGLAPALAGRLGHQVTGVPTPLVGKGTTQSGAQGLLTSVTVGAPTTGQTAYTVPAKTSGAPFLKEYYFFNNAASAVSALLYPPGDGSSLNGSTSAAVTVPQGKGVMFMQTSIGAWFSILSA